MARVRQSVQDSVRETVRAFVLRNDPITRGAEFFQGDSWQVLLGDPSNALRLALLIQASLLVEANAETRTSIGIGSIESIEQTSAISTGEAFTLSGRALEEMSGADRLTGALSDNGDETFALWFPAILHLCSRLSRKWSRRQAEVMRLWLLLPMPTYEKISDNLGITVQSVGDVLSSANLPALREALELFARTNWQHIAAPRQEGYA
ncbi:hypothetical protein FHS83_001950 [Rhizomicrobium palustre]|uniref:Uncharacterized protein n=1 Tax=Rhizomicrobium palustre TaxID=189966 RepID=A0A846N050_9PROT|nr:hypothetical protein [Rhizomicrobium palustre]NIK88632.1 hypothetical protein [Rhizomicrobium palustre]